METAGCRRRPAGIWAQKNAPGDSSKDESTRFVVPPCFTPSSQRGPCGVQTYSCAFTGAPVATCAYHAVSRAAPRPSSTGPSVPAFTIPGSQYRIFPPTLLFLAFEGRYSILLKLHLVYPGQGGSVKRAGCTKKGPDKWYPFVRPVEFYMVPPMRRSLLIFFAVSLRRRFLSPFPEMRRSRRTASRVPTVWKICTRMTSRITAPQSTMFWWRV